MVTLMTTYGEVLKVFEDLDTLAGADLSYQDLVCADFRGMDLSNTNFEGADLTFAEFDDEVFDGSMLDPPDFTDTYYELVDSGAGASGGNHRKFRGY